ncbi:magnesium chelatase subunit D family protein [Aestuariimicrobium kwangyangense]|uniref:magnesium chelatase subunit D family protein n=1 Tax=Aestuariimicrobium kwangyangense TaxID=396389 RepID=UPI0003B70FF9|nr:magnesium chelatase subunit D family protein [Aestuariimicrobium kwangyangense]
MPLHYPFSAVVGCEPDLMDNMGLALVLATISPEIGGVLVRGEKGTAKSTTVRALTAVLPAIDVYADDRFSVDPADPTTTSPDGPFDARAQTLSRPVRLVELPVGATEDRVMGSIHLERALSQGKVEYEPGLLARAHRGVLYVDEVNLLHDHLVDLLLDAAAMGRATVERDGVSLEHPARFVLIGTMNPEEGELRPQFLDRFGLAVEVAAPRDPNLRAEVVRRRMAHDADPAAFAERHRDAELVLTERIRTAQERLDVVRLSDVALLKIATICAAFEVDGLRADLVTARTAVAHAAWQGRDQVTRADIRRAALLALPHRRRRNPFDAPGLDEDLLDQLLGDDELPPEPPPAPDDGTPAPPEPSDDGVPEGEPDRSNENDPGQPEAGGASSPAPPAGQGGAGESQVSAGDPYRSRLFTVHGLGEGTEGRRSRAVASRGHRVGARRPASGGGPLHLVETLLAAASQQPARGRRGGRLDVRPEDIRMAVREGREANLILFCVDASGSMAARKRMAQVKTAILSLLLDAYRRRDKVALITFRGTTAELTLPPTRSVDIAATRLNNLPAGGRTPLADGLLEVARVVQRHRVSDPRLRPLLILVTDGRATGGENAVARSQEAAAHLAGMGVATVVVDGETGPLRLGLAWRLAVLLRGQHVPVAEITAEALTTSVRTHVKGVA